MKIEGLAIAIAVPDLDEAEETFRRVLGLGQPRRAAAPDHGVEVAVFGIGDGQLQLVAPLGEGSLIAKFLDEQGPGLHHFGILVDDVASVVDHMETVGAKTLGVPMLGAEGLPTIFIHPGSTHGALIEFLQIASNTN